MTLPVVNDTTALSSENLHDFVYGDGVTPMAMLVYRVQYDGAAWQVTGRGATASAASVTAVWDGTDNKVTIDWSSVAGLSWATAKPGVMVSPELGIADYTTARYWVQAQTVSATTAEVTFWDQASPGTQETTETTSMSFQIMIVGKIQ